MGLRDRASTAVMGYTFARVSAVGTLRVEELPTGSPLVAAAKGERRQTARGTLPPQPR
jgi:hypothetical protein